MEAIENILMEAMKTGAINFAQWLQNNRWYNFDKKSQKWCYTFEGGTFLDKKDYEKNYMKTSDELWEKFILSEREHLDKTNKVKPPVMRSGCDRCIDKNGQNIGNMYVCECGRIVD